jgi:hypothetical protein
MARVTSLILILLVAMTAACTQSASSLPDNPENRTTLAKKYLEVMPPKELLQGVASRVAPTLPEDNRKVFTEVMNREDIQKAAYRIMLDSLVKNFMVAELNAMVAFYGSPDGQSAWKKFSPYMNEIMPPIQQEVRKAIAEAQKQPETKEPATPQPQSAPPAAKEQKEPKKQKK